MNLRDRLSIRTARARRRPFSLAAELRLLASGLFAVAGAGLVLHQQLDGVGPAEVGTAALVVVLVFAVNLLVGLAGRARTLDD